MTDDGSVTVEAALVIGAIVAVLLLGVMGVAAAADHVRCVDAAREAARLTARGEVERARSAARTIAPHDATIEIRVDRDEVAVTVHSTRGLLPVHGDAYAVVEPGAAP
ncbi:TadE family type IV pilus minor pilin [Actinokineospora diospyrosa]|uniref:TadE-like protein n=1 Tax=Actinokineospora diospyrosa TaxID=103728 RepID=A0ABT1IDJ8_9PSEU|nr:TadE family type IV pilus minor pilin [Actinokineospora diospyrosa]MCP2270716.1 TadE-like protein [Actinokineospora diospyrosa]